MDAMHHVIRVIVKKMKQEHLGNLLNRICLGINETQGRTINLVD